MNIPDKIEVPAPTAWPIVLAFGLTLVFAGMVTAVSVSILGAVLALSGAVGWFRQVLPVEAHEWAAADREEIVIAASQDAVERIMPGRTPARVWLPVEIYPISAGIKGGLAGGAAMALMAAVYGLLSGNGIWYPMNLLVAGLFPAMTAETVSQIGTFNLYCFLTAMPIHLLISLLVGLLYGALLPMFPRRPILLGGFAAPLLWTGLIYGVLAIVNPVMNQHIHWVWFVASQIGFGIVAGLIVAVQERIPTRQAVPLVVRMGVEASGLMPEEREGTKR
jgi:flagellar biosynthesis protein FliQ